MSDSEARVYLRLREGDIPHPASLGARLTKNKNEALFGNWWVWLPLGGAPEKSMSRRCGLYTLRLSEPHGVRIRVVVYSDQVIDADTFARMISEIEDAIPIAVWDTPSAHGSRGGSVPATQPRGLRLHTSPPSLLEQVRRELAAARRIERRLTWELEPRHPSKPAFPGTVNLAANYDLGENRVAVAWARHRRRQLLRCVETMRAARVKLAEHVQEVVSAEGVGGLEKWRNEHEQHVAALEALEHESSSLVAALTRIEGRLASRGVRSTWRMTPAIRRRPDPLLLAKAQVRDEVLVAEVMSAQRALLPLRTTPILYEIWAATELVRAIEAAGYRIEGQPEVLQWTEKSFPGLPVRAVWRLRKRDFSVELHLGPVPHVLPMSLPDVHPHAAIRLSAIEAAGALAVERGLFSSLIVAGGMLTPDYLVRMTSRRGTALCIGDALFSDPRARRSTNAVHSKLKKVAGTYARRIAWVDSNGGLVRCVLPTCFVVTPRRVSPRLERASEASELASLVLAPSTDPEQRQASWGDVARILATLEWRLDR